MDEFGLGDGGAYPQAVMVSTIILTVFVSPGTGKTMLAKRVGAILPGLTASESIESTRIYSAMGRLKHDQPLLAQRPFRSPHHTISDAGLVGGGSIPVPGEISMAHHGALLLDELPEFNRHTLEVMRQPLRQLDVFNNNDSPDCPPDIIPI